MLVPWKKSKTNLDSVLKSKGTILPAKVCTDKAMVSPVVMDRYESWTIEKGWVPKNCCLRIVVLEKILQSLLDSMIKSVNPKGNLPWIFTGRTDAEAEAPILWPHNEKSWLTGKDPDAKIDQRQEEKGMTED